MSQPEERGERTSPLPSPSGWAPPPGRWASAGAEDPPAGTCREAGSRAQGPGLPGSGCHHGCHGPSFHGSLAVQGQALLPPPGLTVWPMLLPAPLLRARGSQCPWTGEAVPEHSTRPRWSPTLTAPCLPGETRKLVSGEVGQHVHGHTAGKQQRPASHAMMPSTAFFHHAPL